MTRIELAPEPPLIPRSLLFGDPVVSSPTISPDGSRLAYLAPHDGVMNVWVRTLATSEEHPVTSETDRAVRHYAWGFDDRTILYFQDTNGDENWRLYATNVVTGATRDLTPFDGVQAQMVLRDRRSPDAVLVALNKEDARFHDVYRLDLASGELELVAKNPGNVMRWVADQEFVVRVAWAADPDGAYTLMARTDVAAEWRPMGTWSAEDAATSGPLVFADGGKSLLLKDARNANTTRLVFLELGTGELTVVAEDPVFDVADVVLHPDTHDAQAVIFERERREWTILDPEISADITYLCSVNDGDLSIISRDNADRTWLVSFLVDDGPVEYWLYDREKRAASSLFVDRPALRDYTLASMEPIEFVARDGLTIHGYLTLPPKAEPRSLPMVLNVHGGPWTRNTWGYHPEPQWFANRGYACLQVNYRGSVGYGKAFTNAGDRQWGAAMHQDLIDAVQWAIDAGYADARRIAIFGGSYGGYAALVGVSFTPDVFCCAVDIVGPVNLATLIRSIPPYWTTMLSALKRRMGDPETEPDFLASRSPLSKADRIRVPLLIAQGANDPRVPPAESEQLVAALKANGIAHHYVVFPDEGHGFAKPHNRLRFYATAERFLALHLGGRFEAAVDSEVL